MGLGEGVAPVSATDLVARGCKQSERARATGFIFSGLHVGSLAGLLVAPYLIENFGWPSVSSTLPRSPRLYIPTHASLEKHAHVKG